MPKTANNTNRPSVLEVRLGETLVGTLTNLPNDQNLFVFDPAYIADANRPVLSLSFYDAYRNLVTDIRPVTRRLPPFFSNLLPEGALRQFIAKRGEVSAQREFLLLWLLGKDLPGAVMVRDDEGRALPPWEKNPTISRTRVGRDVLRFSLTGLQLKLSAIGNPHRQLSIPTSSVGGHWIVKLPSPAYPGPPENEFSMMEFARMVGIQVPQIGLVPLTDLRHPRTLAAAQRRLQSGLRTISRRILCLSAEFFWSENARDRPDFFLPAVVIALAIDEWRLIALPLLPQITGL